MKKLLISTLMLFAFLGSAHAEATTKKSNLTITDINGKTYTVTGTKEGLKISGMEGKVVFLEFFGHECPPCLMSIPHLIELKKKYKDKVGIMAVEVQGFSIEQLKSFAKDIRPFAKPFLGRISQRFGSTPEALLAPMEKNHTINYPVFSEEDRGSAIFVEYMRQRAQWRGAIPFTIILDTTGEVQYIQEGMIPADTLEKTFLELSKK